MASNFWEIVPESARSSCVEDAGCRLYNAGAQGPELDGSLRSGFARPCSGWGRALQSGDGQELIRVIGRSLGCRKLTPVIEAFRAPALAAARGPRHLRL